MKELGNIASLIVGMVSFVSSLLHANAYLITSDMKTGMIAIYLLILSISCKVDSEDSK